MKSAAERTSALCQHQRLTDAAAIIKRYRKYCPVSERFAFVSLRLGIWSMTSLRLFSRAPQMEMNPVILQDFAFFFFGVFDLPVLLRAIAWRTSAFPVFFMSARC